MKVQFNFTKVNRTFKTKRDIKFIVVHYTGNSDDTAYNNTKYFKSQNRGASAHYFVDKDSIWQCVEDKDIAWHCGTKGKYYHEKCRNSNSIGVEMCDSVKRNSVVEDNTAELVRYLMGTYNVPFENVIRHYDVTHKLCPASLVDDSAWNEFKMKLGGSEEMTNEEKSKMQAIDDSLTNLYRIVQEIKDENPVYRTIDDVPDWGKAAVRAAMSKGAVTGDGNALNISYHDLRAIVREYRVGLYN